MTEVLITGLLFCVYRRVENKVDKLDGV
jgi:hypothetical protein